MMHYDGNYPDWVYPDDEPQKPVKKREPQAEDFNCKNCGEPWGIDYGYCKACTPPNHPLVKAKRERERKRLESKNNNG